MPNEYIRSFLVLFRTYLFVVSFSSQLPTSRTALSPPLAPVSLPTCSSEIIATPPIVSWWYGRLAQAQTRYLCSVIRKASHRLNGVFDIHGICIFVSRFVDVILRKHSADRVVPLLPSSHRIPLTSCLPFDSLNRSRNPVTGTNVYSISRYTNAAQI